MRPPSKASTTAERANRKARDQRRRDQQRELPTIFQRNQMLLLEEMGPKGDYIENGRTENSLLERGWIEPVGATVGMDRRKWRVNAAGREALQMKARAS